MKIAIMGFRGIPAKYGGFETFVEELAPRLVERGHGISVYGRSNIIDYKNKYYKGVRLIVLPTISHKYLDTVIHTFFSVIHCSFYEYDIVFILNAANSPFAFIPQLTGKKVVLNVDGIERLRKKWNMLGRLYYKMGEYFATIFPDVIVSDAEVIKKYYLDTYGKKSVMIPYGASTEKLDSCSVLQEFNIKPKNYILYVSRLEPENNAHIVIEAYKNIRTEKKLVIVGDAPYAQNYKKYLVSIAGEDKRIIFTGFVFGKGYREFQSNAYCYIQATEVGGTHPALIEAMGAGNCVLANGTPENIEVLNGAGIIYKKNNADDLRTKLQYVLDNPSLIEEYNRKARERAMQCYSWDSIADKYENLFLKVIGCL